MLRKENLLAVPFVSGWRKLTVGEYQWNSVRAYGFGSSVYNPNSIEYGNLSDRFLNGKTVASIDSFKSAGDFTRVVFSNYESLPERTLYLKREDKETIALTYETGEGIKYIKYDVVYFTEEDVGKTIDIYLGTTPPLKHKERELFGLGGFSHAEQGDASRDNERETFVFDNHKHWRPWRSNDKDHSKKQDGNCLRFSDNLLKIYVRRADENRTLLLNLKSNRQLLHFWTRCFNRLLRSWRHNDSLQSFSERSKCDNHTRLRYWQRLICFNRTSILGGAAC